MERGNLDVKREGKCSEKLKKN